MRKLILLITISLLLPLESAHATLAEGVTNLPGTTFQPVGTGAITIKDPEKVESGFKVPDTKSEVNIEEMLESVVRGRVKPILRTPRRKAGVEQIPEVATLTKAVAGAINNMNTTDTKARATTRILGAYLINMLKQKNPDPAELAKAVADILENIKPADKQAITNIVFSVLKKEKDAIKLGKTLRKKGVGQDIITQAALNSGFTNLFGATTGTAITSCDITEAVISAASKDAVVDIVAAAFLAAPAEQLANIAKCAADAGVSDVDITQAVLLAGIDPTLIQQPTAAGNPNQAPVVTPIAPPAFGSPAGTPPTDTPAVTPIAPPTFGTQTGGGGGEQASSS
ncbi:MAG: hypothetical protein HRU04_12965 [Oceanospirillaceae bacterium]|nr:hypothetical protein [Oceanospirillaceae bacterium]